jgi:hypothetical protein
MPKTKPRKKSATRKLSQPASSAASNAGTQMEKSAQTGAAGGPASRTARTQARPSSMQEIQSTFFPALVALGCWGMAFSFFFFYADPNHNLYAGMAALMALLWTISFALRLRKIMQAWQQRTRA